MKKTALMLSLVLLCLSLFACAPQPVPIEGVDAIRAVVLDCIPKTDNLACLSTPVWGQAVTGDTFLVRRDGENLRYTAATQDGRERTLTIVGDTAYLYEKTPATEEGALPVETGATRTLSPDELAAARALYTATPLSADGLCALLLSGEESAFRMPDGKTQLLSKNPSAALLSEHTGYTFSADACDLFGVLDTQGRLVYLRVTGRATAPDGAESALYLEYALSYESLTVTPPEGAAGYAAGDFAVPLD